MTLYGFGIKVSEFSDEPEGAVGVSQNLFKRCHHRPTLLNKWQSLSHNRLHCGDPLLRSDLRYRSVTEGFPPRE